MPIAIGVLGLVFVGLLCFFVLRACKGGEGQQNDQTGAADGSVEQAIVEEPDYTDINLLMVGDILFHYQVRQSGLSSNGTRNYDHIYAHFLNELADKDIKVLNQETVLGGPEIGGDAPDGYGSYPQFNGPQEMADAEVKAGFNVILKATNHALDMDYEGLSSELSYWRQNYPDVAVVGAVDPYASTGSADDVYVYDKNGFKVAILNYTFDLNGMPDPQGVMSMLEEDHVRTTMAKARELADMIVVFPHWGEEYETTPNAEQRMWAQLLVEEGADVIIGNHPHVMQPVEVLADAEGNPVPCYWSTGNFVSTSPDDMSLLGGVPELTLRKDKDGNCSIESAQMKVVVTHIGMGEDMTVYPLTDWTDELAATNYLDTEMNPNTDNTTLTPAWAKQFCTEVLGSDFDTQTCTLTLDLTAVPTAATTSATAEDGLETTEGTSDESGYGESADYGSSSGGLSSDGTSTLGESTGTGSNAGSDSSVGSDTGMGTSTGAGTGSGMGTGSGSGSETSTDSRYASTEI